MGEVVGYTCRAGGLLVCSLGIQSVGAERHQTSFGPEGHIWLITWNLYGLSEPQFPYSWTGWLITCFICLPGKLGGLMKQSHGMQKPFAKCKASYTWNSKNNNNRQNS